MKKVLLIIVVLFIISTNISAQFSIVSTKIVDEYYQTVFTSFLTPATSAVRIDFPSNGGVLNVQEAVVDARVQNGAVVEARATVSPAVGGDFISNTVNFYGMFRDNNPENCQIVMNIVLLYEIRNDGAGAADLHYALNPNILFLKNGLFASSSGSYSITLSESNSSGSTGNSIYNSGEITASMNNPLRGIAFSNVPAGETRYVKLKVWIEAYSEFASGTIFLVDGSQGLAVGFDDAVIADNNDLNNNPGIDEDAKMKFQLHNLEANDPTGPAMGNTGAFAYKNMDWNANISDAYAIEENTALLDGVDGISVTMDDFRLYDFQLTGVEGVNQGDERVYINGIARIYQNDVLKLELTNCRIGLNVSYPIPFGEGYATVGGGWGEINVANSDASWVTEFDANGTGQVDFVFNSMSTVINNPFYDAVISIVPTSVREKIVGFKIPLGGGNIDYTADYHVSFNFTSASQPVKGNMLSADAGNGMVRMIEGNPGGALPNGIDALSADRYWEFGTTVSSFNANITFDMTGVNGISDFNTIRILHRDNENSAWTILDPNSNSYSINGNQITVDGINSFSQFGIGSTGGNALPVELTSFTAVQEKNSVTLNWETVTELNNYGFDIERKKATDIKFNHVNSWTKIGFVSGNGNSSSIKNYSFSDNPAREGKYIYRLKQIDFDGKFKYSNEIEIEFEKMLPSEFVLDQNYPNPFNPTTKIRFTVPSNIVNTNNEIDQQSSMVSNDAVNISLKVYDVLGNEIAELMNEQKQPGKYEVDFNASNLPSGIYFYSLKAGNINQIKKMMLLK